jgi:hypothetical protein
VDAELPDIGKIFNNTNQLEPATGAWIKDHPFPGEGNEFFYFFLKKKICGINYRGRENTIFSSTM